MRPDGFQRLLDTSLTPAEYVHTAGTRYNGLAAMRTLGLAVFELGQMRGIEAKLIGVVAANNSAGTCRVYRGYYARGRQTAESQSNNSGLAHIDLVYAGLLTATYSSNALRAGVAGGSAILPAENAADGLTWAGSDGTTTPKGNTDLLVTAHGAVNTPAVYSPANDNDDAVLMMPDCFDADCIVFDLKLGSNTTSMNVLARRTR